MAGSVIDSLVVTLGLDSKSFSEGVKGSTEQLAGFTRRLAGMFLAVRSLEDVVGYFKDLHAQLAEIGFSSKNLGVAGTELKRLGEVSELFGGQMSDALDSIQGLQQAVFGLRFKGQMSESLMMLQRFGVAYLDAAGHARNFRDIALDASKAIEHQAQVAGLNQGERFQLAQSMGFSGGVASAVAQGGKGLEEALKAAQVDQKALTEKTIQGQVQLSRDLTRLHESTAAQSSAILQRLTPAIEGATRWLQKLANELIPKLVKAIDGIIAFFKNPPPWFKAIENLAARIGDLLGPVGSLIAAIGGLSLAMGAGGALVRVIGSLITALLLAPAKAGAGAVGAIAPLLGKIGLVGAAAAAGYEVGDLAFEKLPQYLGAKEGLGDWLGGKIFDLTHPNAGNINPAPPTPTARRPAAAPAQTGAPGATGTPTAMNSAGGGTNVQIDQITVNTKATDANGIAADMNGALQRKLLVANADQGAG